MEARRAGSPRRVAVPAGRLFAILSLGLGLAGCSLADLAPDGADVPVSNDDGPNGTDGTTNGTDGATSGDAGGSVVTGLLPVESIEVLILESFPPQIHVVVRGSLPDGCTELGEIVQERSGNAITVTVQTTRDPQALCTQALVPVEETVVLAGDFPPGEYTVSVNGVTESFRV